MIKLNKPDFNQAEIIDECIENMNDADVKNRILSSKNTIVDISKKYDKLAEDMELSTIPVHTKIKGGATKTDMEWLYTNKFARQNEQGRKYYDAIKILPPYGTCPFCGQRKVSTLDHYLPKSKYPAYSITPYNLVAACSECNKVKSATVFNSRTEETIHPYYDDFNDGIWLKAKILEEDPISFVFYVEKPDKWDDEKYQRAQNHFKAYELQSLYQSHASEEFSEYNYSLRRLYKVGNAKLVKDDIEERINSARSLRLNTWRAAMYEALKNCTWFFDTYLIQTSGA